MRGSGGSAVAAGCGGFSLVGLLVGVGLTVWLGSMALSGSTGGGSTRRSGGQPGAASTTTLPSVAVDLSPRTGLTDGAKVTITSDAFGANRAVSVLVCTRGADLGTGADACGDPIASLRTDAAGHLAGQVAVPRIVEVGLGPFDCAEDAGRCSVVLRAAGEPAAQASVPLAFVAGLDPPELTMPSVPG